MSDVAVAAEAKKEAAPAKRDSAPALHPGVVARLPDLPELQAKPLGAPAGSLNHLLDVSVSVTAEIGRTTLSIGDILKLGPGSVVGLDRAVSEPIDLLVQGVPFARGEVVVVDDRFAIRIREIVDTKYNGKK